MPALDIVTLVLVVTGLTGIVTGRWSDRVCLALLALGNFAIAVQLVLDGLLWAACPNTAVGAGCAWAWWHGGGGDDTKRRLKRLRQAFTGVRRTAPAPA